MWRQILTIHDAVARGMDLFDVAELQQENNPADFANLYLCEFVDDTLSVFPLSLLTPCMVDAWETWSDVDWLAMSVEQATDGPRKGSNPPPSIALPSLLSCPNCGRRAPGNRSACAG